MRTFLAIVLAVVCVVAARVSYAETDYTAQQALSDIREGRETPNAIRRLRVTESIVSLPAGSISTADLADDAVTAAKVGVVAQTYTGTAAIAATSYTPAFVGQLLIGTVSNTVHVSENLTTNGWIQLN